jgi:hypothetical protein
MISATAFVDGKPIALSAESAEAVHRLPAWCVIGVECKHQRCEVRVHRLGDGTIAVSEAIDGVATSG